MTLDAAMSALESMGTAQNRKTYARHGYPANSFGVSFADLKKLKKQIGKDHALAQALWKTGNGDARVFATMIADPAAATSKELDAWMKAVGFRCVVDLFAGYVFETPLARKKMDAWMKGRTDSEGQAGWTLLARFAMSAATEPDSYFEERLRFIEANIAAAKNSMRHAMNSAVIAIGLRNPALRKQATAAARRIGKVEVDHGDTACQTPDAAAYIDRGWKRK